MRWGYIIESINTGSIDTLDEIYISKCLLPESFSIRKFRFIVFLMWCLILPGMIYHLKYYKKVGIYASKNPHIFMPEDEIQVRLKGQKIIDIMPVRIE